jgi:hypothetical protein
MEICARVHECTIYMWYTLVWWRKKKEKHAPMCLCVLKRHIYYTKLFLSFRCYDRAEKMAADDASHFYFPGQRLFTLQRFRYFTRSQPRPFTDGFSPLPPQHVHIHTQVGFVFSYLILRRKQRGNISPPRILTRGPSNTQGNNNNNH